VHNLFVELDTVTKIFKQLIVYIFFYKHMKFLN